MVVAYETDHIQKNYLRDIEMWGIDHTSNFDQKGFKGDPWDFEDFATWVNPKNMFEEWRFMQSEVHMRNSNGDLLQMTHQLEKDPSKLDDDSFEKTMKNCLNSEMSDN